MSQPLGYQTTMSMPKQMIAYRKQMGFSIPQLARLLGVSRTTVWRWEHGQQAVHKDLWRVVHKTTGIPMDVLAGVASGDDGERAA